MDARYPGDDGISWVGAMERALTAPFSSRPVELLPIMAGPADSVLAHLIGAIKAELEAGCPTGRLLMESLGNITAIYLAHRYRVHPCELPSDRSGLTREHASRVIEYIDTYLASDLSVAELAGVACLSPYHFGKMFKRSVGRTIYQFVTDRRIERAKSLLKSTPLIPLEIGAIVGFPEQSHFNSVFKRWVGVAPGRYRQEIMTPMERCDPTEQFHT